jgi:hypothetical protein
MTPVMHEQLHHSCASALRHSSPHSVVLLMLAACCTISALQLPAVPLWALRAHL